MSILDDAREGMNLDIRPQDDLFGHVNGRWLDEVEIPADRSTWGAFVTLADTAEQHVREIIESLAAGSPDAEDAEDARKIGDLFASFMDTDRIAATGTRPIRPLIDAVAALRDVRDLAAFLGEFERIGGHGLFGSYVNTDDRNSDRYLFHITQGGLGLPDESYYRDDKFAEIREKYVGYLTDLLTLGRHEDAPAAAATILGIDTQLAAGHWERAETRDVQKSYNLLTDVQLTELCPAFDWDAYVTNLGASDIDPSRCWPRSASASRRTSPTSRPCSSRCRSRTGRPGCSPTCCGRPRRTSPTTSWRPTSTSTAAPSTAPPSCATAGSAASAWSRARWARRSARSTSPATSRRSPRSRWTTWSPTCSRPTGSRSPSSTG